MIFHDITLDDKNLISEAFEREPRQSCDAVFANNYLWRKVYNVTVTYEGPYCVIRYTQDGGYRYSYPFGNPSDDESYKRIIQLMIEDAKSLGTKLVIDPLLKSDIERLNRLFPDQFEFTTDRDYYDYIYTTEKLANLSGKKLHGKRNHIARFMDNPDWSYEDLTSANSSECLALDKLWYQTKEDFASADEELLKEVEAEQSAVETALKYHKELGLTGGVLRLNGEVVAFAIGEPLTPDTYVVHIEKARADIQGAYPMINREFVRRNCMDYTYVNREEDTGSEGLRKAKLSYYPDILLKKYTAYLK